MVFNVFSHFNVNTVLWCSIHSRIIYLFFFSFVFALIGRSIDDLASGATSGGPLILIITASLLAVIIFAGILVYTRRLMRRRATIKLSTQDNIDYHSCSTADTPPPSSPPARVDSRLSSVVDEDFLSSSRTGSVVNKSSSRTSSPAPTFVPERPASPVSNNY